MPRPETTDARPATQAQPMPERPERPGVVTFRYIRAGKPVFDFAGDVAPRWFRYSGAAFTVSGDRLTLRGRDIPAGTEFRLGDL